MDEFPPLPKKSFDIQQLKEIFPHIEEEVVQMVLDESDGNVESAMDILLGMSEGAASLPPPKPNERDLCSSPFQKAANILNKTIDKEGVHSQTSYTSVSSLPAKSWQVKAQEIQPTARNTCVSPLVQPRPKSPDKYAGLLKEVVDTVSRGGKVVLILRGLPGSGKSTLAKKYSKAFSFCRVFSTDDYFIRNGRYNFQPQELSAAHAHNQSCVKLALAAGVALIVVDNTNTQAWEMRPYVGLGMEHGYHIVIQEPDTPWRFTVKDLAHRNTHSVPRDRIESMLIRYEKQLTVEEISRRFNIKATVFGQQLPGKDGTPGKEFEQEVEKEEEEIFESEDDSETEVDPVMGETVVETTCSVQSTTGGQSDTATASKVPVFTEPQPTNDLTLDNDFLVNNDFIRTWESEREASRSPRPKSERRTKTDEDQPQLRLSEQFWGSVVVVEPPQSPQTKTMSLGIGKSQRPSRLRDRRILAKASGHELSGEGVVEETSQHYNMSAREPMGDVSSIWTESSQLAEEHKDEEVEEVNLAMSMDPIFAVQLQELFGPPLDDSFLQLLNTEEMLRASIPRSLAHQFFQCWQLSLQTAITAKPCLTPSSEGGSESRRFSSVVSSNLHPYDNNRSRFDGAGLLSDNRSSSCPPVGIAQMDNQPPRTILAPNAVEYYENEDVNRALRRSTLESYAKKPVIVCRGEEHPDTSLELEGEDDYENYRLQRDNMYRKAMEAKRMGGVAAHYASQGRDLQRKIKNMQAENQMKMFLEANKNSHPNKLDLHYLTTGDAIKQLQKFISERESVYSREGQNHVVCLEVVTGKGTRSEHGKARLRPAVINWLEQKSYKYSEINSGALNVYISGHSS